MANNNDKPLIPTFIPFKPLTQNDAKTVGFTDLMEMINN